MALTCDDAMWTCPRRVGARRRSARPDDFRRVLLRRVAAVHLAEHFDGSPFAERSGEGVAKLLVVCFQVADAGGGRLEAA
jgi:hypothetical protein